MVESPSDAVHRCMGTDNALYCKVTCFAVAVQTEAVEVRAYKE